MTEEFAKFIMGLISEDCEFDQPCHWGLRIEGHAVYCENEDWEGSPRKCKHSWYFGKDSEYKDETCKGYKPNTR